MKTPLAAVQHKINIMKIEKIRFCNLTSYEGEHEIDFTVEPLRSAGIFAICGDTGAGKTTLLDAMCLALYNKVPRLGDVSKGAKIPSELLDNSAAGAAGLQPDDARTFMRRGTDHSWVEVQFSMPSGEHYLSHWESRLTRNDTYRQNDPTMWLKWGDGLKKTFDGRRTEVLRKIEEVVGLSFDQFCRTVLLAQNSFATFLTANNSEKSELLEKLTGSEIYGEVSKQIYERHAQAQQALEKIEARIEGLTRNKLTPDELKERQELLATFEREMAKLKDEHERLKQQSEWLQNYQRAQQVLAQAEAEWAEARKALMQRATAQRQLDRRERVLEVSQTFAQCMEAEAMREEGLEAMAKEERRLSEILSQWAQFSEKAKTEEKQYAEVAEDWEQMQDIFSEGHQLEGKKQQMKEEWALLCAKVEQAERTKKNAKDTLEIVKGKKAKFEESVEQLERRKEELAGHASMLQRIDLVHEKLKKFQELNNNIKNGEQLLINAHSDYEMMGKKQALTAQQKAQIDDEVKRLEENRRRELSCNFGQDGVDLQQRTMNSRHRADLLGAALSLWTNLGQHFEENEDAQATVSRLRIEAEMGQKLVKQRAADLKTAKELYEVEEKKYRVSQGTAVGYLREHMQEGSPCPVCGSTHHPYHTAADVEDEKIFKEQEQRCELLREDKETKEATLREAEDELLRTQMKLKHSEGEAQRLVKKIEQEREEWKVYADLDYSLTDCSPHTDAQRRINTLKVMKEQAQTEYERLNSEWQTFYKHQTAVEQLQKQLDEKLQQQKITEHDYQEMVSARDALQQRMVMLEDTLKVHKLQYEQEYTDLGQLITLSGWLNEWKMNREELSRRLQQMADAWKDTNERLAAVEKERMDIVMSLKRQEERCEYAAEQLKEMKHRAEAKEIEWKQVEEQLKGMFEACTVEEAEKTLQRRLKEVKEAYETAKRALVECEKEVAQVKGALKNVTEQQRKAAARAVVKNDELDRWLERFNAEGHALMHRKELAQLLSNAEDWQAIRREVDELKTKENRTSEKKEEAAMTLAQVKEEGKDWLSGDMACKQELAQRMREKEEGREALEMKRGEVRSVIEAHERSVEGEKSEIRAMEAARKDAEAWQRLNAEFGSADGKKFRQIAQRHTFRFLVEHANAQLAMFSPRYRLDTMPDTLTLKIFDRDMFDEERYVATLSGGETFVVSLSLALGLASLSSAGLSIGSLFIDEGFGNLDNESLDMVMAALGSLESTQGRKVGVISHTDQIREQISPQIYVKKLSGGAKSVIEVR